MRTCFTSHQQARSYGDGAMAYTCNTCRIIRKTEDAWYRVEKSSGLSASVQQAQSLKTTSYKTSMRRHDVALKSIRDVVLASRACLLSDKKTAGSYTNVRKIKATPENKAWTPGQVLPSSIENLTLICMRITKA